MKGNALERHCAVIAPGRCTRFRSTVGVGLPRASSQWTHTRKACGSSKGTDVLASDGGLTSVRVLRAGWTSPDQSTLVSSPPPLRRRQRGAARRMKVVVSAAGHSAALDRPAAMHR